MKIKIFIIFLGLWILLPSKLFSESASPLTVEEEIKLLGIFSEPIKYPDGMLKFFGTNCKTFTCRANKATKEMSLTFKRSKVYHQRKPGQQLYALAMFELFYLNQLKLKEKKVKEFIKSWPEKNKNGKEVVSLIKLNKSREKMRKSLGMDLNTGIEEAIERYWIMGDFLQKGEIKKEKISKDMKKREKLISKYKKAVNNFNTALKNKHYEDLYNKIEKK